jgi:large subunit ribosomal protein L21e
MPKSKGFRRKTRSLFSKRTREKGKIGLSRTLIEFKEGDKVLVKIDPSIHKGMPHRRYHGKIGVVESRRGRAYILNLKIGKTIKTVIARPEHMRLYKG